MPLAPVRVFARTRLHEPKTLPAHLRVPDELLRQRTDGRPAGRDRGRRADRRPERGRHRPVQHLFHPREGPGEGLLRPGLLPGYEDGPPRADHRRGRLRGQSGRRGHRLARPLCRRGLRPADPAPPARTHRPASPDRPFPGRHPFSRDREVRRPAAAAQGGRQRLRLHHGRLQQVLQLLRGAVHPRRGNLPPLRGRAIRRDHPGRTGCEGSDAAGPERQRLPGPGGRLRRPGRLRHAARLHPRHPGHRAHPLHHLAPARVHRTADRRPRPAAQVGTAGTPARAVGL